MRSFLTWLDQRTGAVGFLREVFFHSVPGGAGWRHVWGRLVIFVIGLEFVTGLAMGLVYSPGLVSSWESVHFLQQGVPGGWFVRGLHHWGAQVLPVLLALHLLQLVVGGLYRAPREVVFWLTLALTSVLLATSFTGYILPWDRRGYMASQVSSGLMANVPLVGPWLRELFLGGSQAGQATLTRLATLHSTVLPGVIFGIILWQTFLWRRAVRLEENRPYEPDTAHTPTAPSATHWWPTQAWRDAAAAFALLLLLGGLTVVFRGASLQAPAEAGVADPSARPEWYFLYLFRLLHLEIFSGAKQIIPSLVLPGVAFTLLALMPWWGHRRWGHRLNVAIFLLGLLGFAGLTGWEVARDLRDSAHQAALRRAEADAARANELALRAGGLPPSGILSVLADDTATQGPRLFAQKCASCHPYDGHDGQGRPLATPPSAADLAGFGSREWLRGFLDPAQLVSAKYWGGTAFVTPPEGKKTSKMVDFVTDDLASYDEDEKAQLEKVILALSAEAALPAQRDLDARDTTLIAEGRTLLGEDGLSCTDCHAWAEEKSGKPDLNGWASRKWMLDFLHDPAHPRFYGNRNDRMPAYGAKGELTPRQLEMIVDWLRGEP